jgi:hypothetical protein
MKAKEERAFRVRMGKKLEKKSKSSKSAQKDIIQEVASWIEQETCRSAVGCSTEFEKY